jgi:hypothetical protein
VWEAHLAACYWCLQPLYFVDVTVDHLLPETAAQSTIDKAMHEYGLDPDFQVNDFRNWVPSHHRCNSSKGNRLFPTSPAMVRAFDDARRRAPRARTTAKGFERDKDKARLLITLTNAKDKGTITRDDVFAIFSVPAGSPGSGSADTSVVTLNVSSVATMFRTGFDSFAFAETGVIATHPGGPPFKPPTACPHCGTAWNWPGNVCGHCNWVIVSYP